MMVFHTIFFVDRSDVLLCTSVAYKRPPHVSTSEIISHNIMAAHKCQYAMTVGDLYQHVPSRAGTQLEGVQGLYNHGDFPTQHVSFISFGLRRW